MLAFDDLALDAQKSRLGNSNLMHVDQSSPLTPVTTIRLILLDGEPKLFAIEW